MTSKKVSGKTRYQRPSGPEPKWTIMIYLAGDNNLTANCIAVMQELEAANPGKDVQVLACFDSNTPRPKGSRYLEVNRRRSFKSTMNWALHDDLIPPDDRGHNIVAPSFCLEDRNDTKAADESPEVAAQGLSRFIGWATSKYPADRYMLITYGHGGVVAGQTFLAKDNPNSFVTLTEFGVVLAKYFGNGKPRLDILACDNCVMNGLETAYEIRDQVDFMLGSQGLMLAIGWPYEKIIRAIAGNPVRETKDIAEKILEVCARDLLDFTLMDRSSEQAVCDLTKFHGQQNILGALSKLVYTLTDGLQFESKKFEPNQGELTLRYPTICDAIRLARLEAQAYWSETFVDLYDFCERLMWKCDQLVIAGATVLKELGDGVRPDYGPEQFRNTEQMQKLKNIVNDCRTVMSEIQRMVTSSYYIGADLQYSHGLSIYFPWTLPEKTLFLPANGGKDQKLRSVFEIYKSYKFAGPSSWAKFLETFFRATLRKVRRADRQFALRGDSESVDLGLIDFSVTDTSNAVAINLQKSSSDVGKDDDCTCPTIKNYPRRNYLAPADCARRTDRPGMMKRGAKGQEPVSYLGWNVRGLVAKVIRPSDLGTKGLGRTKAASNGRKPTRGDKRYLR